MSTITVAALLGGALTADAGVVFSNRCRVLSGLAPTSPVACEKDRGTEVRRVKKAAEGVYLVDTSDCRGYVPVSCLAKQNGSPPARDEASPRSNGRSAAAQREPASTKSAIFRVGPILTAGALWGRANAAGGSSSGAAYGGGLVISVPVGRWVRLTVMPTYQILGLKRVIDGSGAIADPNPASYEQKISFIGGTGLFGINLSGASVQGSTEQWWLDLGFEYLTPSTAKQTDNFGGEVTFTTKDRLAYVVFGPSGDFTLAQSIIASAYIQGFYNVGAKSGSQITGLRLLLGLQFEI